MQVLLLHDVKHVGRKGEVKSVSDGYARNSLIPKGLAKPATPGEIGDVMQTRERVEELVSKQKDLLSELEKRTEVTPVPVFIEVGKRGEIFAAVREPEVLQALLDYESRLNGFDARIEIEKPIKEMGKHEVSVSLGRGVRGSFMIELQPAS